MDKFYFHFEESMMYATSAAVPNSNRMPSTITIGTQNGASTQIHGQLMKPVSLRPTNKTPSNPDVEIEAELELELLMIS